MLPPEFIGRQHFSCVLVNFLVPPDVGQFLDCLFVQVIIDSQHTGRGFPFGAAILFDQFHNLSVERRLVVLLLGGEGVEHLRQGRIFRLYLCGKLGVLASVMNFFVDEVGDLLNDFYIIPPLTAPEFCRYPLGRMQSARIWAA